MVLKTPCWKEPPCGVEHMFEHVSRDVPFEIRRAVKSEQVDLNGQIHDRADSDTRPEKVVKVRPQMSEALSSDRIQQGSFGTTAVRWEIRMTAVRACWGPVCPLMICHSSVS